MGASDYALIRGREATRDALRRWNRHPWEALSTWTYLALGIALALLLTVLAVSALAPADLTPLTLPGLTDSPDVGDVGSVLFRNSLVLALHATACVAGFIAGSSLPLTAERQTGISRWIHERARPVALGWVVLVTCFSLCTQAYVLGSTGSTLATQLGISRPLLVLSVMPHAVPELTALFLPLAAWTIASRREGWDDLLAATFATVALAVPVLVAAATWEVYVWPHLLALLSPYI
jgi:stage II sporulation SpoM-like protein